FAEIDIDEIHPRGGNLDYRFIGFGLGHMELDWGENVRTSGFLDLDGSHGAIDVTGEGRNCQNGEIAGIARIATESRGIGKTRPLEFVQLADHACTPQPMTAMTAMTRDVGDSAAIPLRLRRSRRFLGLHRLPLFFGKNISETAELACALEPLAAVHHD